MSALLWLSVDSRILAANVFVSALRRSTLPHPGVALPLDLCDLARDNVDIERTISPDSAFLVLYRDRVVTSV